MEKEKFIAFAKHVLSLEERAKEIKDDAKDAIVEFSKENDIPKKAVKDGIVKYREFIKDQDGFIETDQALSQILNVVIYDEVAGD